MPLLEKKAQGTYTLVKVVDLNPATDEITPGEVMLTDCLDDCGLAASYVLVVASTGGTVLTLCLNCGVKYMFDELPTVGIGPLFSPHYRDVSLAVGRSTIGLENPKRSER